MAAYRGRSTWSLDVLRPAEIAWCRRRAAVLVRLRAARRQFRETPAFGSLSRVASITAGVISEPSLRQSLRSTARARPPSSFVAAICHIAFATAAGRGIMTVEGLRALIVSGGRVGQRQEATRPDRKRAEAPLVGRSNYRLERHAG